METKIKVYALAKELGVSAKDISDVLVQNGYNEKSHQANLSTEEVTVVRKHYENNDINTDVEVDETETQTNKVDTVVTQKAEETTAVNTKSIPRTYAPTDLIPCRSITAGELLMPGKKSEVLYRWSNNGDVCEVEFQDLRSLRSSRSKYIYDPLFVIEDEELISQWKDLLPIYAKLSGFSDIASLFDLSNNEFEQKLKSIPLGVQNAVKVMAAEMIQDGELDSLNKITIIDEVLGTDLKTYIK